MAQLILNSLSRAKPVADYNFFAVRSAQSIPKGFHHIPQLSPSKSLFFLTHEWKSIGAWPAQWLEYQDLFTKEMQVGELHEYLEYVEDLLIANNTIQIVCFCPDYSICHRSLLGKYYQEKGYEVKFN